MKRKKSKIETSFQVEKTTNIILLLTCDDHFGFCGDCCLASPCWSSFLCLLIEDRMPSRDVVFFLALPRGALLTAPGPNRLPGGPPGALAAPPAEGLLNSSKKSKSDFSSAL